MHIEFVNLKKQITLSLTQKLNWSLIQVIVDRLWGAQTQRSLIHFPSAKTECQKLFTLRRDMLKTAASEPGL
jgi:fumarate hydratase class II